jgi:uncharacterized protein
MLFYKNGLKFKCQKCGGCCGGFPGYVWLTKNDKLKISNFLKITIEEFRKRYCRLVKGRWSLKEKHPNYDCIFLKDKKCQIYQTRPIQCITFPFWPEALSSNTSWEDLSKTCPGVNHPDAKVISCDDINQRLEKFIKDLP